MLENQRHGYDIMIKYMKNKIKKIERELCPKPKTLNHYNFTIKLCVLQWTFEVEFFKNFT